MSTTSRGPAGRKPASGPRLSSRRQRSITEPTDAGPSPSAGSDAGRAGRSSPSRASRPPTSRSGASSDASPRTTRGSFTTRAAVLLGVLAILAASYAFPVRAWLDQREQLSVLGEQRDALAAEVESLTESRDLWDDPAYVRSQARERLNYVLPGEVGIVVLGTESTTPDEPVTGTVVPASESDQPWWSTLVTAFSEVGSGDPTQAATETADSPEGPVEDSGSAAQEPGSDAADTP